MLVASSSGGEVVVKTMTWSSWWSTKERKYYIMCRSPVASLKHLELDSPNWSSWFKVVWTANVQTKFKLGRLSQSQVVQGRGQR
jgi:hypothetical protein